MPHQDNTRPKNATPALTGQGAFEARGFGTLWLVWSPRGLTHLVLPGGARPFAPGEGPPERTVPTKFAKPLTRYFAGREVDLSTIPVDLRGTDFQVRVWRALRAIPWGRTRSYAGIAADVGRPRGMRAVGMANAKNPIAIVVPCHRVVESGMKLGGYSGGLDQKRFLLRLEGVKVDKNRVLPGQLDLPVG